MVDKAKIAGIFLSSGLTQDPGPDQLTTGGAAEHSAGGTEDREFQGSKPLLASPREGRDSPAW